MITQVSVPGSGGTAGSGIDRGVGTVTIVDDDPGTGPAVSIGDMAAAVPMGKKKAALDLPITLSTPLAEDVTVGFVMVPGDATSKDLSGKKAGKVTILAGSTTATLAFKVKPHLFPPADRTFSISLVSVLSGNAQLGRTSGLGTLLAE